MAEKRRGVRTQIFTYEVYDKNNVRISGEISARNLNLAKAMLKTQGYNVIKINKKSIDVFAFLKTTAVKPEQVTLFTRQLATLTAAGIPLVQGLGFTADSLPGTALYETIMKIKVDVESGSSFSVALKKFPLIFDELYCGLMETGEQSGTLDLMLNRLAIYREKSDSLKRKVKKALYYPAAVLIIAAVVTTILLVKVVPTFKQLFSSYGAELPMFTQFVLNISDFLQEYGFYVLGGIILFIILFRYFYNRNVRFNHTVQTMMLKIPVVGPILRKIAVARFARTLATMAASGVPLIEGLDSVSKAVGNYVYSNAVLKIKESVSAGQQMRAAMKKTGVFPTMLVQMVGIGEESGALEDMLNKAATIYEEEVDTQVDGLTTLLEPVIMAILGIIVGGLVIAMYLPIFKMGGLF